MEVYANERLQCRVLGGKRPLQINLSILLSDLTSPVRYSSILIGSETPL